MRWPAWTGVGERPLKEGVEPAKTAWDFLQLLIVPGILVVIALAFNASQASRDRSREDKRTREDRALADEQRQDAVLDAYIRDMRGLILDRDLTRAKEGSSVRQVARTATLTTLRRLDGRRKGEVVRFLTEARLLEQTARVTARNQRSDPAGWRWSEPVINLERADLRGADLARTSFWTPRPGFDYGSGTNRIALRGDLRGARFDHAVLDGVDFGVSGIPEITDLRGASFAGAQLTDMSMFGFDLRGASFEGANLETVNFELTDLRGTVFDKALISNTHFDASCLTKASFAGASFNMNGGAPIPDAVANFLRAKGQDVDFSDAVNLSSVRLSLGVVDVRFGEAKERPKRTPRSRFPAGGRLGPCK